MAGKVSQTVSPNNRGPKAVSEVYAVAINGERFSQTTWKELRFTGSNPFTLIATGEKGEQLTVNFKTEPSSEEAAQTASATGDMFGKMPAVYTLYEELVNPNGERKFAVTH